MPVESERLSMRPVEDRDIDAWATFLADRDALRLVHFPEPHDRPFAQQFLDRTIAGADGAKAMYAVTVRATGETAGFVGHAPRELDGRAELELGWLLLPAFHGRGYATEAAARLRPLVPGRVVSLIRVENAASINVARKLGMRLERDIEFAGFRTHVFVSDAP